MRKSIKSIEKKLTFGKLKEGELFIGFPVEGDNKGHGGYLDAYYVYQKTGETEAKRYYIRSGDSTSTSSIPKTMHVIKVE
jgi:hypothetical protein